MLPEYLVLNTGSVPYKSHWAEKPFWFGFEPDEDMYVQYHFNSYKAVDDVIGGIEPIIWYQIAITRRDEKILLFRQFLPCPNRSRIVAFTNNENFWTYFVLKYR